MHLTLRKPESIILTGLVLSGFWVSSVIAQVTPSAGSTPPKLEDKPLVLSPFIVSTEKDTGYIAADTLNAGRLSTNLLMTPGNIDVMTRDFINDLGVFNIDEASGWLTNSRPLETGAIEGNSMNPGSFAQQDSGTNVSLRGVGANPSTRNYFTSAATPKEYNVERVESARGPNAILYGEGGPGGSVNYITKRAQDRNFTTLRLRFDDNWSKSASLDINRKLTDKLDARYNVNLMDKRYFLDRPTLPAFDPEETMTNRPFENTVVSVDVDITHNTRPGMITSYGEQYSQWDHVPVVGKLTGNITTKGLANWTGGKNLIWVDGIGMQDYTGYAHSAGSGLPQPIVAGYGDANYPSKGAATGAPGISAVPVYPDSFNANPDALSVTDRARDFQVSIDHTFQNKISLELAGQYSKFTTDGGNYAFSTIYLDVLQNLPNGMINPNYNKPYVNSFLGRNINYDRDSKSARFVASYPLTFWGGTTNLSAFLLDQEKTDTTLYTDLHIADPASTLSITDASSLIHVNSYLDNIQTTLLQCPNDPGPPCALPLTVGNANIKGAELELEAHPTEHWSIDGSWSHLNFKYTSFSQNVGIPAGASEPGLIKSKYSIGTQYELPLPNGASLVPRVDFAYTAGFETTAVPPAGSAVGGYHLLIERLTYKMADDKWEISGTGSNLMNNV